VLPKKTLKVYAVVTAAAAAAAEALKLDQ